MRYSPETLRRLQLVLLEIVKDIDRVCRKNDISYFLDSGSCLGAVRHGGFIPWDDDMDLGMLRSDYDRFLEIAPRELGNKYVVAHPGVDDRLAGQFAKVWKQGTEFATKETIEAGIPQGIFVDVFPYDELSANADEAKRQLADCRMWQSLSYLYHAKTIVVPHKGMIGAMERLGCRLAHGVVHAFCNPMAVRSKFEQAARHGSGSQSGLFANMTYTQMGCFPKEMLTPPVQMSFEGVELPVPADSVGYLEQVYGKTWNELPPEDQRRNHAPEKLSFGD